jgi:adenine specific DNA methylase Mod
MNTLYYGDNLRILREHIADESVDLIYLDPPFNSKRVYNVYIKKPNAEAQVIAFEDSEHEESKPSGREGPRYPDMARGRLNFKKAKKAKDKDQPKLFE